MKRIFVIFVCSLTLSILVKLGFNIYFVVALL